MVRLYDIYIHNNMETQMRSLFEHRPSHVAEKGGPQDEVLPQGPAPEGLDLCGTALASFDIVFGWSKLEDVKLFTIRFQTLPAKYVER